VAIDVNTGTYVGRGSTRLEDTIVKTTLEAVKETCARFAWRLAHHRARTSSNGRAPQTADKVMAALDNALRADREPSKALPFNEFGLVAVTASATKQALERVL